MATVKRDQILQEAEKLVARGKLDAAVREYRRALEQSPNDTNTLNRLGDLLVRIDRVAEAIDVYGRIAEHFAEDGFFLKSIAIYKKINRLDPQRTEVYEKLADLYFKQGLVVEGRQQLLTLADWFLRSKQPNEAVRVYRRLGELEPTNFQVRAKLVDLLTQLGAADKVKEEIDALGKSLLSRGMLDEAVKLYHRALDMNPADCDFVAPCVDALVSGGRAAQAAELGRRALGIAPGGTNLRRATARALSEAGDLRAARELLEGVLPEVGERTDVVQLYGEVMLRVGESEEAKEHLLPAIERLLAAHDHARAGVLLKRLLRSVPGDIEVLEKALEVFDRREDPDLFASVEASLADAYFRSGAYDAARPLYRSLAAADPANKLFQDRLVQLGDSAGVESAVPAPAREEPATGALDDGFEIVELDLGDAAPIEVAPPEAPGAPPPTFEEVPSEGAGQHALEEPQGEPVEEPLTGTNAEELLTEAVVFAKYGLTEKAIKHLHRLLALDPTHEEGRRLLSTLGGGEVVAVEPEVEPTIVEELPPAAAVPADLEIPPIEAPPVVVDVREDGLVDVPVSLESLPPEPGAIAPEPKPEAPPAPPQAAAPAAPARGAVPKVKLEDLEAIIGLTGGRGAAKEPKQARKAPAPDVVPAAFEISFDTLFAAKPAPKQKPVPAPSPEVQVPAPPAEPAAGSPVELVEIGEVLGGPDERQLREVDFFIQQGLLDEAARQLARIEEEFAEHPEVAARHALLKARGWEEQVAAPREGSAAELFNEEEQFFDLAAELEQELADEELVAEARGKGEGDEVSIEELFREFQRGVAEQLGAEDFDTHFNLGIAYREMGLLDEAIGEFQLAAKSPEFAVEAASLIAGCYVDKGLLDQAVEWFTRALKDPSVTPEAELGLRYELGRVHEAAGNHDQALANYAEVLAVNPGFRDVVERVSLIRKPN